MAFFLGKATGEDTGIPDPALRHLGPPASLCNSAMTRESTEADRAKLAGEFAALLLKSHRSASRGPDIPLAARTSAGRIDLLLFRRSAYIAVSHLPAATIARHPDGSSAVGNIYSPARNLILTDVLYRGTRRVWGIAS